MKCPACHSALIVIEREEIEVDWCPSCHGLWFDEGELELLGEKAGRVIDTEDLGRILDDEVGPIETVAGTRTTIVLRTVKEDAPLGGIPMFKESGASQAAKSKL